MTLQHLVMQLAVSGHLFCVSQQVQSLLEVSAPSPPIAFIQSDISVPAMSDIAAWPAPRCFTPPVPCPCVSALPGAAAHAEAIGEMTKDSAISIASKVCRNVVSLRHNDTYRYTFDGLTSCDA